MNFPKQRFAFKITQQVIFFFFYYLLLLYCSYLYYPLNNFECLFISLFLTILEIAVVYVEFVRSNSITRFTVEILDSLKWFALMILFLSICLMIFNYAILEIPIIYDRILLVFIVGLFIYGYYNAHTPTITERTLFLNNLDEEIDIIHLSDIHVGSIRRQGLLKKISDKINQVGADLVIISGDLADGSNKIQVDDFEDFKKVNAPIIFTPGNHDYYTGIEHVFEACENAGMMILDNAQTKYKDLNIYGLSFSNNAPLFEINKNENNLLIYHIPANWDEFAEQGFNIMLTGHTHGGQFYPANLWVKLVFPLLKGLFEKNGNYLNVSDGAGTMGPPVRLGTKSEVGLLKLRKKED